VHEFTDPRIYWVTLIVTDNETGETSSYGASVYAIPEFPYGVSIWPGWNFVSVPRTLEEGENTAGIVFAMVQTEGRSIWWYNATAKSWHAMTSDEPLETLDAYWVYSSQVGPYIPYYYSTEFGGSAPRVKHLDPGWNAIGMGSVNSMNTSYYLASLVNNWSVMLEFDSETQVYYPPQIYGLAMSDMQPTKGYWIYMKERGDLLEMTG
jgi:hypothetical protein